MNQNKIIVTGAREHNLKNISLEIPKNKLVVFTGLSGSGKSSLAFDTLYAEGQRRYVESLSSYARQFLGIMQKPDVDHIEGLSPAISIDQKTTSHNPRSTVGTITEIYDYLRLLFARVGRPHCPNCGREVAPQTLDQIVQLVFDEIDARAGAQPVRLLLMSPVVRERKGEFSQLLENLQQKGFQRARIDGRVYNLDEDLSLIKTNKHTIEAILDRLSVAKVQLRDESERKTLRGRLTQSIEQALQLSEGLFSLGIVLDATLDFPETPQDVETKLYSEKRACSECGISMPEIEPRLFSFNSPQGACPECNGLGSLLKIDIERMIAPDLTLSEGAIIPFARMLSTDTWWSRLVQQVAETHGISFRTTAYYKISTEIQELLLNGSDQVYTVHGQNRQGRETMIQETFEGFVKNLERRYRETDSEFIRKEIEQYMQRQTCPLCSGARLKDEALSVHIDSKNIAEITATPIDQTWSWARALQKGTSLTQKENIIAESILKEITSRLEFLNAVGLSYLTLSREASTLAGGEAQRIRLASQIGTGLTGVLYILDEPTIGLHQRDNHQLIYTLKNLQQKGNSVIVVEHDRDVMLAADHVIDFGPAAGKHGGTVVAQGTPQELMADANSLTGKYLKRKKDVLRESKQPKGKRALVDPDAGVVRTASAINPKNHSKIRIEGASHHNLKSIDVEFPINTLTCITGISGSGKSTLLHDTLYAQLAKNLGYSYDGTYGKVDRITIPNEVKRITLIDQSPIGKTPRSNPATYTKIFDFIRTLYANTKDAQIRGYKSGRFSFNVKGGRCEACQGDGQLKIEMQFLPDVYVTCDVCMGKRYNTETLEVLYKEKNIAEVLEMTVDDAFDFFKSHSTLRRKLLTLKEVGLGYIQLGQPAPTLSGGEAQRVKLARELSTRALDHVIYMLDEPTTGLHFADVQNLLNVLDQLVSQNNTVITIEHNLDVIKNADWIIDLGPEGGDKGGEIVAVGTPAEVAQNPASVTGMYLKEELAQ
jgi:excinuclease ABC subunit A